MTDSSDIQDVLIVGGGPAGLSAALVLARCGRSVTLVDAEPVNGTQYTVRGYLNWPDGSLADFRNAARAQLAPYAHVCTRSARVVQVCRKASIFEATTSGGEALHCRKLLLATGPNAALPGWPGAQAYLGRGIYQSPYSSAWEYRNQSVVVVGNGGQGHAMALELKTWTPQVTLCTDGPMKLPQAARRRLRGVDVGVRTDPIAAVEGDALRLRRIRFVEGPGLDCTAIFVCADGPPDVSLARQLGCGINPAGLVLTDRRGGTSAPGVYVAGQGDTTWFADLAIGAAAEGARAAQGIHQEMVRENLDKSRARPGSSRFRQKTEK